MGEKIVLIDGHSILNRAFYGLPDLTNSEGLHTNAIYGFLNIMFKILEEERPEYLTVAFDVHAPTFRHEMYKEYKGTRKPMAEELREQVPVMKEVLAAMGIKTIEQAGLEADDLLGTLSVRGEAAGMEVSVISGDRDLLQQLNSYLWGQRSSSACNGACEDTDSKDKAGPHRGGRLLCRRREGKVSGYAPGVYRPEGAHGGFL